MHTESGNVFVIRVQGKLVSNRMDYFEGFSIRSQNKQIILTGEIEDHSALMGMLDSLCMLGLELISLERGTISKDED